VTTRNEGLGAGPDRPGGAGVSSRGSAVRKSRTVPRGTTNLGHRFSHSLSSGREEGVLRPLAVEQERLLPRSSMFTQPVHANMCFQPRIDRSIDRFMLFFRATSRGSPFEPRPFFHAIKTSERPLARQSFLLPSFLSSISSPSSVSRAATSGASSASASPSTPASRGPYRGSCR